MAYAHTFSGQNEPKNFKPCSDGECFGPRTTMNPNACSSTSHNFPFSFTSLFAVLQVYSPLHLVWWTSWSLALWVSSGEWTFKLAALHSPNPYRPHLCLWKGLFSTNVQINSTSTVEQCDRETVVEGVRFSTIRLTVVSAAALVQRQKRCSNLGNTSCKPRINLARHCQSGTPLLVG